MRGLARAGFKVRAAVRDPEQGEYVKGLADGVEYTVVEDMTLVRSSSIKADVAQRIRQSSRRR